MAISRRHRQPRRQVVTHRSSESIAGPSLYLQHQGRKSKANSEEMKEDLDDIVPVVANARYWPRSSQSIVPWTCMQALDESKARVEEGEGS